MFTTKFYRTIGGLILISLLYSCDEDEPCSRCSAEIQSSFENKLFSVLFTSFDTLLLDRDGDPTTVYSFATCSSELLRSFENDNVIKVSGSFRNECESGLLRISVDEAELVESCLPTIPQLEGSFPLDNIWYIDYIQTQDTLAYTPCDATSFVTFNTGENSIQATIAINWLVGDYELVNDSTMRMPPDFAMSLAVGNSSQMSFLNLFGEVIEPQSLITYSINKNVLTLKNKADNSSVRLYVTQ
jgi:hypothetical protein